MKMTDEMSLLGRMGATVDAPDAGCCGMAGPFGFARDTAQVGRAIGERVLLPAVRNADDDVLIVSNGFSCQEQITHGTGRRVRSDGTGTPRSHPYRTLTHSSRSSQTTPSPAATARFSVFCSTVGRKDGDSPGLSTFSVLSTAKSPS